MKPWLAALQFRAWKNCPIPIALKSIFQARIVRQLNSASWPFKPRPLRLPTANWPISSRHRERTQSRMNVGRSPARHWIEPRHTESMPTSSKGRLLWQSGKSRREELSMGTASWRLGTVAEQLKPGQRYVNVNQASAPGRFASESWNPQQMGRAKTQASKE